MKPAIRTPFFEIGVKNYIFGDDVFYLAQEADRAAKRYDVDVLFTAPYADIRRVAENTERLIVIAPYMDTEPPGRGMANVLPESLKAAGARGVVINHCEKPMTLAKIRETIERAKGLDMLSFVCADTVEEAKAVALFHPDIINPEPSGLIGSGRSSDLEFAACSVREVKAVFPDILVEQAAGITSGMQVFEYIMSGADGAGAASGIVGAVDPFAALDEMIASVRRAKDMLTQGRDWNENLPRIDHT